MNDEQVKAVKSLQRALNKCHDAGLSGGVFDTCFCVWPKSHHPLDDSNGGDFFESVEKHGAQLSTKMYLDGGAGT